MKKNKIMLRFFLLLLIVCLIIGFKKYTTYKRDLTLSKGVLASSELLTKPCSSTYIPKILFEDMKITEVKGLTFDILDNKSITDIPVILKAQRYYIPVSYISKILGYSLSTDENNISLKKSSEDIILQDSKYKNASLNGDLRGNIIKKDNDSYISVSDIEQIFKLTAVFDFKDHKISLFHTNNQLKEPIESLDSNNAAIMRLEDVSVGDPYDSDGDLNQTNFKCIADLLYSRGVKYHVGWIPRYKDPSKGIDNNLLEVDSINNVGFINLLDYLINHNAVIGLHGYTHQSGDETTGAGVELSDTVNNTTEAEKDIIENVIDTSTALNIKCDFFESPHNAADAKQKDFLENYFQYIYEPFNYDNTNYLYKHNNTLYVPTPLGYVKGNDVSEIVNCLTSPQTGIVNSFYFHPFIEYNFIKFTLNNDTFKVTYDNNSPLHQIIDALDKNNFTSIHIDELNKNTTS